MSINREGVRSLEQSRRPMLPDGHGGLITPPATAPHEWSILLPFHNEAAMLPATIASLAAQRLRFRLVLIDNGSTDGSMAIAQATCAAHRRSAIAVHQPIPGKVAALAAGLARVETAYVATCDADSWYPPDYLGEAARLLKRNALTVAAGALFVGARRRRLDHVLAGVHWLGAAALLPAQCHSGGAGQVFRTAALRRAGGFDTARWNYVLEDHEIFAQLAQLGEIGYGPRFWCVPSPRKRNRIVVRWSLVERIAYHLTPQPLAPGFFARMLGPRLAARRLTSDRLRERPAPGEDRACCG